MIHLRPDCLVFKTSNGEHVPCSVEHVTVELLGEAVHRLNEELVQNAAEAVLHYFKTELGRSVVSIGEFSAALERVLRTLGVKVHSAPVGEAQPRVAEADLRFLVSESGDGFELVFFQRLRDELRQKLDDEPQLLRFRGLRGSVKQLVGAKRWSTRCQNLNDQIVDYLRTCLSAEGRRACCALLVE